MLVISSTLEFISVSLLKLDPNDSIETTKFCVFTFFLVFYLWSYIKTLATDPGHIPLYWGFWAGDSAETWKRYCVICNIFKPDRTHHCSTCNVCVLNMDHHCPWLNSCIGFWNRKTFILMLIYLNGIVITFFASFIMNYYLMALSILEFLSTWESIHNFRGPNGKIEFAFEIALLFILFIMCVLSKFTWYHLKLIKENKTTI